MAFPADPLDTRVDLQLRGVWTDVTADVYTRDPITITRGRADEGQRTDPSRCELTLNNRDGRYSARNPMSPYYGMLGRNTPVRVSVSAGPPFLELPGDGARASTPHVAALNILGSIDVRAEVQLANWDVPLGVELAAKYGRGTDRSWYWFVSAAGELALGWSSTGADYTQYRSSVPVPLPSSGRVAVRSTLDVTAGRITHYTAPTIAGPWTQLGVPNAGVGATSVFSSTVPVEVGDIVATAYASPIGAVRAFQLRTGINGTVVANADFTAQTIGAPAFTDGAGRAWTLSGNASISNRNIRFQGEVSAWPPRWDVTGRDVYTPIEAAGLLRRYGQGAKALDSALRRRLARQSDILAYWPMEDGDGATRAYSPLPGVAPLTATGVTWASATSLPSSAPLPVLNSNSGANPPRLSGAVPAPPGAPTGWQVRWVYRLDTPNATLHTFMRILSTGTVTEWYIQSNTSGSRILGLDADGTSVISQPIGTGMDLYGQWTTLRLQVNQSATNTVTWGVYWQTVGGDAGGYSSTYTGTIGRARGVASPPDGYAPALDGMAIGHITVFSNTTTNAFDGAITAYADEPATDRLRRLAREEDRLSIGLADSLAPEPTEAMGPQNPQTLLTLIEDCADADGGILYESLDRLALTYRTRASLYNQPPTLTLNYLAPGEVAPPLEPTEDDQQVRNDITIQRDGGSSGRVVIETGPLSVLPPEQGGVGIYDESITLNVARDSQTQQIAGWRAHLGTVDEARYTRIHLQLHTAPHLIPSALNLRIGDLVRITSLPPWLPPGDVDVLAYGYTETLDQYTWNIVMNAAPATPWTVGVTDDPLRGCADTDGSILAAAVTSTTTALELHTDLGAGNPRWVDSSEFPDDFPLDIRVGGEAARLTAITNRLDLFSRTLSGTWGTATTGQLWTQAGGLSTDRAVTGGRGTITLPDPATISTVRFQQLTDAGITDCEIRVRMSSSVVATGASLVPGVLMRCESLSNFYRARIHFGTGGLLYVSVTRDTTQIGDNPQLTTYAAGDEFELRVRLTGHTVQMRVWPVGAIEPDIWHHTVTITTNTIPAGTIGVTGSAFAGMSNASPVLRYDNFEVVTPQMATAVRSVNGIVKPHPAGTDIRLATPMIIAL
ncbi:hypothetical protein [Streptomyces sp. NPDC093109]|uniref:hypothetical protein n=1 Tax=Streptomyces sp. NPDC093109 TaxID=3154977 RepID=UPI00345100EE